MVMLSFELKKNILLSVYIPSVIMLIVIMLIVIMLIVIMSNVIMRVSLCWLWLCQISQFVCHYADCHYAYVSAIMLIVIILCNGLNEAGTFKPSTILIYLDTKQSIDTWKGGLMLSCDDLDQ